MRAPTLILLLLCALNAPVDAQHLNFSALRDSLARVEDTALVRRLELDRRPVRKPTAADHIRHGLTALRLYDLTGDHNASKRARAAFESALKQNGADAWAQFGLGVALASSPEAKPVNEGGKRGTFVLDDVAKKLSGNDPRSRARRAFTAAMQAVPPVAGAARGLADLGLKTQNRETLEDALTGLSALAANQQAAPEDLLALASVYNALNDTANSIAAADRARAALGTAAADYAAAIARMRTAGHEDAGFALYKQAIERAAPSELDDFYYDIIPLLEKREREQWLTYDVATRRDKLAKFWDVRAALGGVTNTQRVAEHFKRLAIAQQRYLRTAEFGVPSNSLILIPAQMRSRFDDRGDIYVRHGEPAQIVRTPSYEHQNESWLYILPDRSTRLYHFLKYPDFGEFVLPYSLPCGGDFWDDRAHIDARGARLALPASCSFYTMSSFNADWRHDAWNALETDTHHPNFVRELPFLYDLYTFRGTPGKTTVVAAFAVPANALETTNAQEGRVRYRFDLSLILADTASGTVSRTDDSSTVVVARPLSREDVLRAHLEVQVPPSPTTLQRVIVTDPTMPGIGQLYGGPFPIPDYSGKQLMVSSIAMGQPNATRGWTRGNVTLALVPTGQFAHGSFSLYYEIYNLPSGHRYTTEVVIERVDKSTGAKLRELLGGKSDIRVKFEGESTADASGTQRELREIQAALGKGRFRMTVTVRDNENGQTAKSSRVFVIPD